MLIDVSGIRLNCETAGAGPAVALLHGLGGSAAFWPPRTGALAARYRLLMPDLRGHGASDKPPGPYSITRWSEDLLALLDALAVDSAVVLGSSLGGAVAQRFALDHPDRVVALVLVATSSEVGQKARDAYEARARSAETDGLAALGLSAPNEPAAYAAASRAAGSYNFTAELARVACPALILQGADDRMAPPGGSVIISRNLPGSELHILDNCGHDVFGDGLDRALAPLESFLARVTAGTGVHS